MRTSRTDRIGNGWRTACVAIVLALFLTPLLMGQAQEPVDLDAIYRIKEEGLQRSHVMELMSYLTDVYGPRLTGSPNLKAAADYTTERLQEWKLQNVALEPWGTFGRGWSNDRFYAHAISPQAYPIIGYPKAWTPGTDGPVTAEAVMAVITSDEDLEKYRGTLEGKFVLTQPVPEVQAAFEPLARRHTDADLTRIATQPQPGARRRIRRPDGQRGFARRRTQFFLDEGVAALLEPGGAAGVLFVGRGGSRNADDPAVSPQIELATEHYGRIARTLEKDIPVTLEFNIQNTFHDETLEAFNIIGEIPGTDKADEIVILGAHFDSWHASTGATDNASGSAVMMEAMRILKSTGLSMRRTIRLALWTGEEQGLLGSRAYVTKHFADRETMALKPAHAKVSAYFNVDNGTGAIRGVYLQGNEAVRPIFEAWRTPFANLGMTTLSIRNTRGTDHLSFDAVGLPGFQFIQDPMEYRSRTHHTNMDSYERIQPGDMMKNAVIVAAFAYHAANRDELLPRKPLPRPRPAPAAVPASGQAGGQGRARPARSVDRVLGSVDLTAADRVVKTVVERLDFDSYKALIKGLTEFGDREQGTPRNAAAVDWIEAQLRSWGYETERLHYEYTPRGSTQAEPREEVYATKVGSSVPGEMYILGAHMDGRGGGEAANDDASGTALVMEIARVLASPDVETDRSVRFALWNNEETGLNGSRAYVEQRASRQGIAEPAGSDRYPEPTWLGMIQHDMMLWDHGNPVTWNQVLDADVDIEFQLNSAMADESAQLAMTLLNANRKFATDYPAVISNAMSNTDSRRFEDLVAAVSLRENRRLYETGNGANPHWHQPTDLYDSFTDADFRLGFNAAQTTLGAVAGLVKARVVPGG